MNLIERLRGNILALEYEGGTGPWTICNKAADTIERQAALLKQAKAALMYYDFANGVPQAAIAAIEEWEQGANREQH